MATNKTLLAHLESLPPSLRARNPLTRLSEDQQKEWDEYKAAMKSGKLRHLSFNEMYRQVCKHFNIKIPRTTFRDFLVKEGVLKRSK